MKALLITLFVLCGTVLCGVPTDDGHGVKRYALVIGSNLGGPGRSPLVWAVRDAQTFAGVMTSLGGISPDHVIMVKNPGKVSFLAGLAALKQKSSEAVASDGRREIMVYYSGHADNTGILLGKDVLTYSELKSHMSDIPAEVRIAVLDACASGGLTRTKGGVQRPAFLYDASAEMAGHAYLTSSSLNEAAQESDHRKCPAFSAATL